MTKLYVSSVIVSGSVQSHLGSPGEVRLRRLARVRVLGRLRPMELYEVLDAEAPQVQKRRQPTLAGFEDVLDRAAQGRFDEAEALLDAVLEADPWDAAATLPVNRCRRLRREGVPADWDRATTLGTKERASPAETTHALESAVQRRPAAPDSPRPPMGPSMTDSSEGPCSPRSRTEIPEGPDCPFDSWDALEAGPNRRLVHACSRASAERPGRNPGTGRGCARSFAPRRTESGAAEAIQAGRLGTTR
jgi:hypothetical protein